MSTVRDAIRDANRLTRMRQGQSIGETVVIPSNKIVAMQVPLSEAETQAGIIKAANLNVPDNMAGMTARNRAAAESDVWNSLREMGDLTQKVFSSIEEMVEELEPTDIDYLIDSLTLLMEHASPTLDGLTDKDLDDLKKDFAAIELSELSGRRWAAVKLALTVLMPEQLQARLSGSSSTGSSTERSESAAST